jgi:hypothetical protein
LILALHCVGNAAGYIGACIFRCGSQCPGIGRR